MQAFNANITIFVLCWKARIVHEQYHLHYFWNVYKVNVSIANHRTNLLMIFFSVSSVVSHLRFSEIRRVLFLFVQILNVLIFFET